MSKINKLLHVYNMFDEVSSSSFFYEVIDFIVEKYDDIPDELYDLLIRRFETDTEKNSEDFKEVED